MRLSVINLAEHFSDDGAAWELLECLRWLTGPMYPLRHHRSRLLHRAEAAPVPRDRYVGECDFHYNVRKESDSDRMALAIRKTGGKRLMSRETKAPSS